MVVYTSLLLFELGQLMLFEIEREVLVFQYLILLIQENCLLLLFKAIAQVILQETQRSQLGVIERFRKRFDELVVGDRLNLRFGLEVSDDLLQLLVLLLQGLFINTRQCRQQVNKYRHLVGAGCFAIRVTERNSESVVRGSSFLQTQHRFHHRLQLEHVNYI